MRIAHITSLIGSSVGIEKRIKDQAAATVSLGSSQIDFFVLNSFVDKGQGSVKFVKFQVKKFPLNYYSYLFKRYQLIEKTVDLNNYDYVILRYPRADKSGLEFVQKFNVITEHHSLEIPEMLSHLSPRLSLPVWVTKTVRILLEKRYGHHILQNCKGLITVTNEIKVAELNRINTSIPAITVGNGIDVKTIKQTGFKPFDEKQLDIAFVAASLSPWHGIDRVIQSLNHYKGNIAITLHIIGDIDRNEIRAITTDLKNLKFYGVRRGEKLDSIMSNMNLAVSTMSLFRKNMNEACSLKTREYTARGLPFILAYKDADLTEVNNELKFCLPFDNDDSLIDFNQIVDFAAELSKNNKAELISNYMREYAFEHMNWQAKMRKYLEFVEHVDQASPEAFR